MDYSVHTVDRTPRIITIIGLILEGFGVASGYGFYLLINLFRQSGNFTAEFFEISNDEFNELVYFLNIGQNIVLIIAIVMTIFFAINLYLFINLLNGAYTEKQAKNIYLYQAIWGGVSLLFNQFVGILYLVSGVQGYSGHKEETNIRKGI